MRWRRTTEEWELLVEALQDKLEAEHEKRLDAEAKVDELEAQLAAGKALWLEREKGVVCLAAGAR